MRSREENFTKSEEKKKKRKNERETKDIGEGGNTTCKVREERKNKPNQHIFVSPEPTRNQYY